MNSIFQENRMAPEYKARQAMYIYHNIQACVCNVCCSGKAI